MKIKIISDGTSQGTKVIDSETGKMIPNVTAIEFKIDTEKNKIGKAKITFVDVPVEIETDAETETVEPEKVSEAEPLTEKYIYDEKNLVEILRKTFYVLSPFLERIRDKTECEIDIELLGTLENTYGIDIDEQLANAVETVGELKILLMNKGVDEKYLQYKLQP
jgi:hypothetical protein